MSEPGVAPVTTAAQAQAVLLGYQGYGNVGDEAILTGLAELLRESPIRVTAILGGPEPIPAFPDARRLHTPRQLPTLAAVRALRRADLLVISGGGLFHDHWRRVTLTYLAWHLLARLAGTRIVWAGVGVGPLRTRLGRFAVRTSARLATRVTVRDRGSAALLGSVAPGVTVTVVPDPAVANPLPRDPAVERAGLGIILRAPTPADHDRYAAPLAALLAGLAREVLARGRPASLITFGGTMDEAFLAALLAALGDAGPRPAVERLTPDPAAAIDRLARLEEIVSVRLHGLVLGALAGTPAVPIVYDTKVAAWADLLGLADLAVGLDRIRATTPADLRARLSLAGAPARRRATAERVTALRDRSTVLRDEILLAARS